MLNLFLNRNSALACLADCPADNHARQLAQFLYETLPPIRKMKNLKLIILLLLLVFSCKDNSESNVAVLTDKENLENFYQDYDTFWNPTEKDLELIKSITEGAFHRETADF